MSHHLVIWSGSLTKLSTGLWARNPGLQAELGPSWVTDAAMVESSGSEAWLSGFKLCVYFWSLWLSEFKFCVIQSSATDSIVIDWGHFLNWLLLFCSEINPHTDSERIETFTSAWQSYFLSDESNNKISGRAFICLLFFFQFMFLVINFYMALQK